MVLSSSPTPTQPQYICFEWSIHSFIHPSIHYPSWINNKYNIAGGGDGGGKKKD